MQKTSGKHLFSKKSAGFRYCISFAAAGAALAAMLYWTAGPRLGFLYDKLMEQRPKQAVSNEIVLIETNDGGISRGVISAAMASSLITILTEMDAGALLLEAPVLGAGIAGAPNESELVFRFDEEFDIISSNIKNLFDGIRTGSIAPEEVRNYVTDVLKLTEQGKIRLLSSAVQRDEEFALRLEKTAALFGAVYIPSDISVDIIRPGHNFSQVAQDSDGVLRRIPFVMINGDGELSEHIVYAALKKRPGGGTLAERFGNVDEPQDAQIIFELPQSASSGGDDSDGQRYFKTLPLSAFLEYAEMDKMLYRLLSEATSLAQYTGLNIEKYPPFMYEQSMLIQDAMLDEPGNEIKANWIASRDAYFKSLADFFDEDGLTKNKIHASFQDLIQDEKLDKAGIARLIAMREEQLTMYSTAEELYKNLQNLRIDLQKNLNGAFCIAGELSIDSANPASRKNSAHTKPAQSAVEISALLANSFLTGNIIRVGETQIVLFWSLIAILFSLLIINKSKFIHSLLFCFFITMLTLLAFSYSFVFTAYWIDPLVPAVSVAAGTLMSAVCAFVIRRRAAFNLTRAYGAFISKKYLKQLILAGKTTVNTDESVCAAIVVVRNPDLGALENHYPAREFSGLQKKFREEVCKYFFAAEAVVAGCDTDSVTIAFGSPLERTAYKISHGKDEYSDANNPVKKAAPFIKALYNAKTNSPWHIGVDYGECVFSYSPLTGYTAAGSRVLHARILSTLTSKHNVKALVSKAAAGRIDASEVRPAASETETTDLYFELIV